MQRELCGVLRQSPVTIALDQDGLMLLIVNGKSGCTKCFTVEVENFDKIYRHLEWLL